MDVVAVDRRLYGDFGDFYPSTLLIWFALGAVLAMGTALIPGLELNVQLIVFALGSLGRLALLRPYILAKRDADEENREVNEFDQALIGIMGVLVEPIVGGKGRARIGDTTWIVTGPDLPKKTRIRVTSVDGIRLGVKGR